MARPKPRRPEHPTKEDRQNKELLRKKFSVLEEGTRTKTKPDGMLFVRDERTDNRKRHGKAFGIYKEIEGTEKIGAILGGEKGDTHWYKDRRDGRKTKGTKSDRK